MGRPGGMAGGRGGAPRANINQSASAYPDLSLSRSRPLDRRDDRDRDRDHDKGVHPACCPSIMRT